MQLPLLDKIYEPAEDSYLLARTVKVNKEAEALDLGCGSGIQTINMLLQGAKVTAVDKDEVALKNTQMCAQALGKHRELSIMHSHLFDKIPEGKQFDHIVFNPPYVESHSLAITAVDGGKKGRQVLDEFIGKLKTFLKANGTAYFLQSSQNGTKETEEKLAQNKMEFKIVGRERIWFEELLVYQVKHT